MNVLFPTFEFDFRIIEQNPTFKRYEKVDYIPVIKYCNHFFG